MENVIELTNIEINECCTLDKDTKKMTLYRGDKKIPGFTGIYFRDEKTFFGLYPTENGPVAWYDGKEYPIIKDLTISVKKKGDDRTFSIEEYGISIDYLKSPFIGFDSWSTEIDVDLFIMIEQKYKTDEFYEGYTKKTCLFSNGTRIPCSKTP